MTIPTAPPSAPAAPASAPMRRLHRLVETRTGRLVARRAMATRVEPAGWAVPPLSPLEVVAASLGSRAEVIGALVLALQSTALPLRVDDDQAAVGVGAAQ